jgi:D-glycero-alpha-D-manno-heptose 1-phosphate guanylyltransferase
MEKKFVEEGYINCGVYLINKNLFNQLTDDSFSFEEFLQNNKDLDIDAFISNDSYFIDIGIPEDYKQAQTDFKEIF